MINEQTSIYLTTQMSKLQSGFPISCQKSLLHVLRAKHILFFRMTKRNEYVKASIYYRKRVCCLDQSTLIHKRKEKKAKGSTP